MPTNAARVEGRRQVVRWMGESWIDEQDPESNLTDLLADLMHWAYSHSIDFE